MFKKILLKYKNDKSYSMGAIKPTLSHLLLIYFHRFFAFIFALTAIKYACKSNGEASITSSSFFCVNYPLSTECSRICEIVLKISLNFALVTFLLQRIV